MRLGSAWTRAALVSMLLLGASPGGADAASPAAVQAVGAVSGTVVAAIDGLPLEDALVELTPIDKGRTTRKKVKADGKFSVELPPGRYRLAASLPGFMQYEEAIDVTAGETLSHQVRLKLGKLMETVHVSATRSPSSVEARTEIEPVNVAKRAATKERLLPPASIRRVYPAYSRSLAQAGKSGEVVLVAIMGADGQLTNLRVLSTPHDELAALAIEATSAWTYDPARLNAQPVDAVAVTYRYVFSK